MIQQIELKLPNKPTFRPAELVRILGDLPGFSRSNLFRKLMTREIPSERTSERGIIVYRVEIIRYFKRIDQ